MAIATKSSPCTPSLDEPEDGEGSTPALEREHVQQVYERIARSWHGTRYKAWPRVEAFARSLARGSLIADVGAGNGKNLPACARIEGDACPSFPIASDLSFELAKICAERGFQVAAADVTRLPFRTGAFDAVLCIAVLHHLSTRARRERACAECCRLLAPGGRAVFYAWAQEQEAGGQASAPGAAPDSGDTGGAEDVVVGGYSGHRFPTQDVLVPFHVPLRCVDDPRIHALAEAAHQRQGASPTEASTAEARSPVPSARLAAASSSDAADGNAADAPMAARAPAAKGASATLAHGEYDAAKRSVVFQRYCHVYCRGELEALFEPLVREGAVAVEQSWYDCGNWCAVVVKLNGSDRR